MSSDHDPQSRPVRRWATTSDAAAYIKVHPEVLRRWNRERHKHTWLPKPRRVGKDLRWDLNELDTALEGQADDQPND